MNFVYLGWGLLVGFCENGNELLDTINYEKFLCQQNYYQLLKNLSAPCGYNSYAVLNIFILLWAGVVRENTDVFEVPSLVF
jgi:hypothetical protein